MPGSGFAHSRKIPSTTGSTFSSIMKFRAASSAQSRADRCLHHCYESNTISLTEYQTRVEELRRAVRVGIDSAVTCTDGIPSMLRQLTSFGWLNARWHLISVDCDHFSSETWEENFACCYRNAQCILSSLFRIPDFRKRLFGATDERCACVYVTKQYTVETQNEFFIDCRLNLPFRVLLSLLEHILSYIQVGRVSETSSETDDNGEPVALILLDPNIPVEAMCELVRAVEEFVISGNPGIIINRQASTRQPPSGYNWVDLLRSMRVHISELIHPQYQLLQVNGLVETESDLQDAMAPENITIVVS